ncbi:uncharacterized protein LOC121373298 [Gigantopelta aegis]|uniref:uncharacterized protein LOC121373298 n=1 Tax=Gigantopelta aegis TaxID=1735272 RepID=UPI001B88B4C6|nr:uncharacterized protein LOC121373298 [Gigantopelta aegis]
MAQAKLNAIEQVEQEETIHYEKNDNSDWYPPVVSVSKSYDINKYVRGYIQSIPVENTPSRVVNDPESFSSTQLSALAKEFVPEENSSHMLEIEQLTSSLAQKISLERLLPPEPGIFIGNPLAYPAWKAAFETLIERQGILSAERIYYLKRYLDRLAMESLDRYILLSTDEAYEQARTLLDKCFGNSFIVTNAFRDKSYKRS